MKKILKSMSMALAVSLLLGMTGVLQTAYALNGQSSDEALISKTADEALPFTEKLEDDFLSNKILVTFKHDSSDYSCFSREYAETVIKPEIIKAAGEDFSELELVSSESAENGTARSKFLIRLKDYDKEKTYNIASALCDTGYYYSVELVHIPVSEDEALPFEEKSEGDFTGSRLLVMFKNNYSKEYIETVIRQELAELAGEDALSALDFTMDCDADNCTSRLIYCISFNFDDKERIYKTAADFYNTGYFYSVEMDHIPIPADKENAELIPDGTEYGDVNNDGFVNVSDVVALNMYLLNKAKYPLDSAGMANADCMRDNVIDTKDTAIIMNYISEIIEKSSLGK